MEIKSDKELNELKQSQVTTIDEYLETGKSEHTAHGHPILQDDDYCLLVVQHGVVYQIGDLEPDGDNDVRCSFARLRSRLCDESGSRMLAAIVPARKNRSEFMLVRDGDEFNGGVCVNKKVSMTTLSFQCLAELLPDARGAEHAARQVGAGKVSIVDCTADEIRPISAALKEKIKALKKKKVKNISDSIRPPEAGMTLMLSGKNPHWHRSATVLLTNGKQTYLIGQDEGTYFGCELQDNPETIKGAYTSLTPPEARKAGVKRQGEWFAVPVPSGKVPLDKDCLATCPDAGDQIVLPRQTMNDNMHTLRPLIGEPRGEVRIHASGVFATGCDLHHEEHDTVFLPKNRWYTFVRNTAVRSVSQEGVD